MGTAPLVHDHHVRSLEVDAASRTITLRTASPHSSGPDFLEVAFEAVEAYMFRGDALGTILFEIEVVDPLTLYREYATKMQDVYAANGGHAAWTRSDASAAIFFSANERHGYRIRSSIGLEGAIWAGRISVR